MHLVLPLPLPAHPLAAPHPYPPPGDPLPPLDPPARETVHEREDEGEGGRDGEALEVLGFALGVLGDERDGGVEAREAGEAAADEAGEDEGVEGRAEAAGEGEEGGGDAEGDLGWG